jgi:hypothetical protein
MHPGLPAAAGARNKKSCLDALFLYVQRTLLELIPVHVRDARGRSADDHVEIVNARRSGNRRGDRLPGLPASGNRQRGCGDGRARGAIEIEGCRTSVAVAGRAHAHLAHARAKVDILVTA